MFGSANGESGNVDKFVVSDWKSKLSTICDEYVPRDIFNIDETRLIYRASRKTPFFDVIRYLCMYILTTRYTHMNKIK